MRGTALGITHPRRMHDGANKKKRRSHTSRERYNLVGWARGWVTLFRSSGASGEDTVGTTHAKRPARGAGEDVWCARRCAFGGSGERKISLTSMMTHRAFSRERIVDERSDLTCLFDDSSTIVSRCHFFLTEWHVRFGSSVQWRCRCVCSSSFSSLLPKVIERWGAPRSVKFPRREEG